MSLITALDQMAMAFMQETEKEQRKEYTEDKIKHLNDILIEVMRAVKATAERTGRDPEEIVAVAMAGFTYQMHILIEQGMNDEEAFVQIMMTQRRAYARRARMKAAKSKD